jgi:tetratricopeptide (TPR) repeat protein
MKKLLLAFFMCVSLQAVFGQFPATPPGIGQAVDAVSTIGRGLRDAKAAQNRAREQEETDFQYANTIILADTLYNRREYEKAIAQYQRALTLKDEQYPKDRIAQATVELGRLKRDPYQLAIDAGDSLYKLMRYEAAVGQYNKALALKAEDYPQKQLAKANAELERWKKVHFSGLRIAGQRVDDITSRVFSDDPWSDFVAPGKYEWVDRALMYSNFQLLDGIAVPADTRLVIYSERNFRGTVVLDVTGPAIITNSAGYRSESILSETFGPPVLQETFPPAVRTWSTSDMHLWVNGSMQIIPVK